MTSRRFSELQDGAFPQDTDVIGLERADGVSYKLTFAQLAAFAAQRASVFLAVDTSDAEDPAVIPGPRGADGAAGTPGAAGASGRDGAVIVLEPEDPESPMLTPGPAGAEGAAGATGPIGRDGAILFFEPETEDILQIPGPVGATGPQGPAGGGGGSATTVETDLGSTAKFAGKFTITDAAIGVTSKVLCWQAPGPYTGKGTRADEAELAPVKVTAVTPAAGSAIVYWETPPVYTAGDQISDGGRLQPIGATYDRADNQRLPLVQKQIRINKVRGNVKFSYLVFS